MKKIIFILLLSIFNISTNATTCVESTFKESKVTLYLCQNYSNYNETRALLFKARTVLLNEYIIEKIGKGQLQNKKVEIQLFDPLVTYKHLNITKGKDAYFVTYAGFPSFHELQTFVDFCSEKNWKPFFTSDFRKVNTKIISKQIEKFFANNKKELSPWSTKIGMTLWPFKDDPWSTNNLYLDYRGDGGDSLNYQVDSTILYVKPTSSLPIKIKDRFLLFQSDSIFVLQGQKIIKSIKIDLPITKDYDNFVFNNWVNICDGGTDNWVYSYSYNKNYFYKRDVKQIQTEKSKIKL